LLAAALELITVKGYAATSIDDIAALADVARGTAINYFPRKEDYLTALVGERQAIFRRAFEATDPSRPALDRLVSALDSHARSYENDQSTSRPLVREWLRAGGPMLSSSADSIAVLSNIIGLAKSRREASAKLNSTDAATLLLDAFYGALGRWAAHSGDGASLRGPLMRTIRILVRAFRSESSSPV